MTESIHILHTNDIHSHLEHWPRIRRWLLAEQTKLRQSGSTVVTLDIGDAMDRVHPLTEATDGRANVALFNQIGYDAVTIGNNEGIGNSQEQLNQLYDQANFDVVLANLRDRKTKQPPKWALRTKIITTAAGTRIALFGLTAPYISTYRPNGWEPELAQQVLPELLAELAGKADVLVLLSHLGLDVDKWIAKNYPAITVIIGSHTHHLLINGLLVNQSLLAAAGRYGQYIGHITLTIDAHHRVLTRQAGVVKTSELPVAPGDRAEIAGYRRHGHQQLKRQKIATLSKTLSAQPVGNSPQMTVALHAVAQAAGTDVAFLNTGIFLAPFKKGIITADDLHQALPHAMHLLRIRLRGYDVWRLVQEIEKARLFLRHFELHGLGFRGKLFGDMVYQGLSWDSADRTVKWRGQPLDPDRVYTMAAVDTYLYFPFFPTIEIVGETEVLFPGVLRNAIADYLKHSELK
ncbi:bifunctional metallophosphatase/5'-nucleotidase [Loigolactobacillus coryniformis]|jgi:2',3'-cyclic-nucleotide 2'-phosphodiesterase (5'-nucleotidase family)|uniref:Bifunctional metallophosphatase/5'-nucleotidase n=1 Tax=Loigolactobacillus coryniformis TaxID=1610 RepID=A0A5B8TLV8_9LACO|nr:bifunctional metallophosphatase/5'-nucleotidase [Loigolactobacillus coryniformis]QEA53469.1 bifunctional metallophosphatase/5'-nucleotidase [Loigolactobacillus coryniformis]RRG05430.1 MAG: bifunctional metallophosphatase/5'-nucleotidase [Lactobacillus sp.]